MLPHLLDRSPIRAVAALLAAATLACAEPLEPPVPATPSSIAEPLAVTGLAFRQVSAGFSHTCGITAEGVAYCWGSNDDGTLGTGTVIDRTVPVRVRGGHEFRQIRAGAFYTCAVTTADIAYCWGLNASRRLGTAGDPDHELVPAPVAGGLRFREVIAGGGTPAASPWTAVPTVGVTTAPVSSATGPRSAGAGRPGSVPT